MGVEPGRQDRLPLHVLDLATEVPFTYYISADCALTLRKNVLAPGDLPGPLWEFTALRQPLCLTVAS